MTLVCSAGFGESGAAAYPSIDAYSDAAMNNASDWLLPHIYRELFGVIGRDATFRLAGAVFDSARRFGLQYVPAVPAGTSFDRIVGIIGEQAARALCESMGGNELRFPPATAWVNRVRDASVREAWRTGTLAAKWIGWTHGITERQVRNICRGESRLAYREVERRRRSALMTARNARGCRAVAMPLPVEGVGG